MQILKRLCPILEMSRESAPPTPTPTKKVKKLRKKRKKGKGQIMEPLDESKPLFIAMIDAAAYRSLTQKKDVKTFSITPC
jgi:hypothetical protein